jgi:hypothetical protein
MLLRELLDGDPLDDAAMAIEPAASMPAPPRDGGTETTTRCGDTIC